MRWLLDFDSTLSDTFVCQVEAVNKRFGTAYTEEDFVTWETEYVLTPEQAEFMWGPELFFSEQFQLSCPMVRGAADKIFDIVDRYPSVVVSDRHPSLYNVTKTWLDNHGLGDVPLVFTRSVNKATANMSPNMHTKSQVAWHKRLDTVVEDAPHNALALAGRSFIEKVYLLDKPNNRTVVHPKIERIVSWEGLHVE